MVFKNGSQCLGYCIDGAANTVELTQEIRPMHSCTPMKLMISSILAATPKEAKEVAPEASPGIINERMARSRPTRTVPWTFRGFKTVSCQP